MANKIRMARINFADAYLIFGGYEPTIEALTVYDAPHLHIRMVPTHAGNRVAFIEYQHDGGEELGIINVQVRSIPNDRICFPEAVPLREYRGGLATGTAWRWMQYGYPRYYTSQHWEMIELYGRYPRTRNRIFAADREHGHIWVDILGQFKPRSLKYHFHREEYPENPDIHP